MSIQHATGHVIRTLRKERNLVLRDLALLAHISPGHISVIETGTKQASNVLLESIAKGLDIKPSDLMKKIYEELVKEGK